MRIFSLLFCFALLYSCTEDGTPGPVHTVEDFMPYSIGVETLYRIDSITYDNLGQDVFISSRILIEKVVDTIWNSENDQGWRIERYVSDTDRIQTNFHSTVTTSYSDNYGIYTEFDLRYAKLQSPIALNRKWEGNQFVNPNTVIYINGESLEIFKFWPRQYEIIERGSEIIGDIHYDDVVTVLQVDADSKLERRYSIEKYARNIGLVYKELWVLDTQCTAWNSLSDCIDIPWEEKAEKGFILKQWRIN